MPKRLPPRDRKGRFRKRAKRKPPVLTIRSIPARGDRQFIQRYFIDKFRKGRATEWEVWTIASKKTPPLHSKSQLIRKVKDIV